MKTQAIARLLAHEEVSSPVMVHGLDWIEDQETRQHFESLCTMVTDQKEDPICADAAKRLLDAKYSSIEDLTSDTKTVITYLIEELVAEITQTTSEVVDALHGLVEDQRDGLSDESEALEDLDNAEQTIDDIPTAEGEDSGDDNVGDDGDFDEDDSEPDETTDDLEDKSVDESDEDGPSTDQSQ
jgi:hypothetical protein